MWNILSLTSASTAINSISLSFLIWVKYRALAMISYNFKDGPWKHAYVKFGYDPRKEKDAVGY